MKNGRRSRCESMILFTIIGLACCSPAIGRCFPAIGPLRTVKAQSEGLEMARRLVSERRDLDRAMAALGKLTDAKSQAEVKYLMARIDYMWGKYSAAYQLAKAAVELSPSKSEYHVLLAKTSGSIVKLSSSPDPSLIVQVKHELEAALTTDPNNIDAREVLVDYYYEVPPEAGGSMANAYKEAQAIIQLDSARGRLALGDVYQEDKKYAEMDREYKLAIAASPGRAKTYRYIAANYLMLNRSSEGRALFQKAHELDPDDEYAGYEVALFSLEEGQQLAEAERLVGRYLTRWPDENQPAWADAHYHLGQIYQKEKRYDLAEREWHEALKLDPNLGAAKQALEATQSK